MQYQHSGPSGTRLLIGLMSGTSLDGIDGVLTDLTGRRPVVLARHNIEFGPALRSALLGLHHAGENELDRASRLGNRLADLYADCVQGLLKQTNYYASDIKAIGCHGQTIRHVPQAGYTIQLNNPARLAERTGITVVSDFRSRDIAAGGQGAPLVPAFHEATFGTPDDARCVVNIGGIANLTRLDPLRPVCGFDTGPGNMLMDAWTLAHLGQPYDYNGKWAASGTVIDSLLNYWLSDPYFSEPPPKSTGRDLFNHDWLAAALRPEHHSADVQATLLALTAHSIANDVRHHAPASTAVYLCGGGAFNPTLVKAIANLLPGMDVMSTDALGVPAMDVEALAFAWLAARCLDGLPGNLPSVTGASGSRILGAIYPA